MIARWALAAAAVAALNASLTFGNVWPTLAVQLRGDLSVELAVLILTLMIVGMLRGRVTPRAQRWLAVVWVALIVGRYVDVTVRSLYGREIDLYWDLRFVPDVSAMFAFVATRWQTALFALGLVLAPVLVYVLARWAIAQVSGVAMERTPRGVLTAAAAGVLLLWMVPVLAVRVPAVRFAEPVTPVYWRAVAGLASEIAGAGEKRLAPPPVMDSDLSRVNGADVFVIFIESYGAVSWDRPELASPLTSSRQQFEAEVRATGRSVVSAQVASTTFGGESWLAHISLLSGTEVRDHRTNLRLMAQQRDTLVKVFGRHGYRTVAIMPGVLRRWPEGAFYGFDDIYNHGRLDYRGPPFGWWDVTDQFALARIDALEVAPQPRRPLFVFFPTISTHAPFTPAPPYQPDWPRVLTSKPYDAAELDRAWSDQPDWLNLAPSYVKSLDYTHATLAGYLGLRADRDLVMLLIGDHQPPGLVSGEGASWNVPVHVIASRPAVLDRLRRHGFRDGLTPPAPAIARMDTLLPILLDAFGDSEGHSATAGIGSAISSSAAARR